MINPFDRMKQQRNPEAKSAHLNHSFELNFPKGRSQIDPEWKIGVAKMVVAQIGVAKIDSSSLRVVLSKI